MFVLRRRITVESRLSRMTSCGPCPPVPSPPLSTPGARRAAAVRDRPAPKCTRPTARQLVAAVAVTFDGDTAQCQRRVNMFTHCTVKSVKIAQVYGDVRGEVAWPGELDNNTTSSSSYMATSVAADISEWNDDVTIALTTIYHFYNNVFYYCHHH